MNLAPEQKARLDIDAINLAAGPGVAVREARMASGHGFTDDLLFVNINGKASNSNPASTQ